MVHMTANTQVASLIMMNLDCSDPVALADFYHHVLGWEITHSQPEYAMVSDGHTSIGFGQLANYRAPAWPDESGAKQVHLDLGVSDIDAAEKEYAALGATTPEFQPGETWRVMLDPAGHPFCLCQR